MRNIYKLKKKGIKVVTLGSILIKWNPVSYMTVNEHPYYKALIANDMHMYHKAISASSKQLSKPTADWQELLDLKVKIYQNGYIDGKDPIRFDKIKDEWCCIHGRHRICILFTLYGSDLKLILKRNGDTAKLINIRIDQSNLSNVTSRVHNDNINNAIDNINNAIDNDNDNTNANANDTNDYNNYNNYNSNSDKNNHNNSIFYFN